MPAQYTSDTPVPKHRLPRVSGGVALELGQDRYIIQQLRPGACGQPIPSRVMVWQRGGSAFIYTVPQYNLACKTNFFLST